MTARKWHKDGKEKIPLSDFPLSLSGLSSLQRTFLTKFTTVSRKKDERVQKEVDALLCKLSNPDIYFFCMYSAMITYDALPFKKQF